MLRAGAPEIICAVRSYPAPHRRSEHVVASMYRRPLQHVLPAKRIATRAETPSRARSCGAPKAIAAMAEVFFPGYRRGSGRALREAQDPMNRGQAQSLTSRPRTPGEAPSVTRHRFIFRFRATATIAAFEPLERRSVTVAQASSCAMPPLAATQHSTTRCTPIPRRERATPGVIGRVCSNQKSGCLPDASAAAHVYGRRQTVSAAHNPRRRR